MRAVVLVGGRGTRLRPLTYTRPKQMLPVVNRPMVEHVLGHLAAHGVDDVVLSLGYRPDAFVEAYPDGRCAGVNLHYAVEPEALDTAGAIRFAALDAGIDDRFIVLNGDVLTDLDIGRLVEFHESRGAEATITLHRVDDPSRYGVVPTDEAGRVLAFIEKPPADEAPTNLINAGTYVLEPSVIDRIPAGRRVSVERETFPALVDEGSLYALDGDTYWIDTGTPRAYVRAQLDLLDGVRGPALDGVHAEAKVDVGAVATRSAVGAGAVVDAGAHVSCSVLLPGARVGPGAVVESSVLGEGAEVAPGARVTGYSVIGDGVVVERDARLEGVRVPGEDG
ncbi:MAG TPA: NDP-sugar synthase [Acidimicrobiales bacterium]